MKILSLFDGISCARVALDRAGIPVEAYYASEIDKYAIQISKKNYPDIIQIGNVKQVEKLIGDEKKCSGVFIGRKNVDLLIGGSPCQDLSIAKKNRKGLDGERSGLFWEYVRILNEVKPKYFILENVNSMPKEAKELITKTLGVEPVMINASLVSAQNRKRLFWVGRLIEERSTEFYYTKVEILQPEDRGILLKDILEPKVGLVPRQDEKANTITTGNTKESLILENTTIRKLTPIECERLQGLPDNYTEGVSNTQRYKALGNAFNCDVVSHILSFIPRM